MFIIFPNQLYYNSTIEFYSEDIFLVEEPLLFGNDPIRPFKYHKCKLAFMVAAMQEYMKFLRNRVTSRIKYIAYDQVDTFYKKVAKSSRVLCWDPLDHDLLKKYMAFNPRIQIIENSNFLVSRQVLTEYHRGHEKRCTHTSFYKFIKSKINVLEDVPSMDVMNRSPLPKNFDIHGLEPKSYSSPSYQYARKYISSHHAFSSNPGSLDHLELWPITPQDTHEHLMDFIKKKLTSFGKYQDAMYTGESFLFHSTISPMLNIGILDVRYVISEVMKQEANVPINSLEGFIRQLIGWREYMRYLYIFHYERFMGHVERDVDKYRHLSTTEYQKWVMGNTGLLPVDTEIQKCLRFGFTHHIVRLMVFLNMFILTRVHPQDIYKWFMEVVAMDAYDWVMKSNIYCMGYFYPDAMTKGYISTSNYILKMSNYPKGEWCKVWDALFYVYVMERKPSAYLRNLAYFSTLSQGEKNEIIRVAKEWIYHG